MKYHLNSRKEVEDFINSEVLTTSEAMQILDVNRSRMSALVKAGKLSPVKKTSNVSLFLKSDIESKKEELEVLRVKYRPYD
ncbi:DNA-binding protein [Bacillus thuringiensis]|uniref:DNA-binding protein n=1 Tax=Bacillus thuringiensis TaxID=1428 RepID=A0A9X6VG24_BACTU|nr:MULTISPECIES: helix-turn-helix domain-containing protein [Bacillus]KIP23470.1 helix-turn-helix domain protein [Bacillus thuringiensis serovar morrisoni]MCT6943955.1 helix-turn-helix domain-containing protein [Bacillus thuringiensis]MEC2946009.1 helix-turn-helix domain-containing protein [Bacillus cereus]MEC3175735.1 helix-turn-helix domain-containing protein [Bacillus cereus]MED2077971.1 helix-turn-helix domain-containing protein [Bacillus thuringiensis]